ncbi:MAG: type II toxin-antitoxin system RelE/ParE family toxin [Candidatus Hydrothermarchaeaceae archaeon]
MGFEIIWSEPAVKELKRLDRVVAKKIFEKVDELSEDPYRNVKKLVGLPYFRLRVGDYRAILDIQKEVLRVLVLKVGHRKKIYK